VKETTIKIDKELLDDIERTISDQLEKKKGCGRLRKSDSHKARIRYLFEFWKQMFVYGGVERHLAEQKLEELRQKKLIDDLKRQVVRDLKKKMDTL
jgi:hypothetical protein